MPHDAHFGGKSGFVGTLRRALGILLVAGVASGQAEAVVITYASDAAFVGATTQVSLVTFDDKIAGQALTGDEYLAQGFKFRSPLAPPQGDLNIGCAVSFCPGTLYLNVFREPFAPFPELGDLDSLIVTILGDFKSFAFTTFDNEGGVGENIQVYGDGDVLLYAHGSFPSFFGVTTDAFIRKVVITELDQDQDDVAYDNFRLADGRLPIAAPVTGTLQLVSLALLALAGLNWARHRGGRSLIPC
jgi:hypothetical protein